MAEMTDEEVFGKPKEFSDAEVFGNKELSDSEVFGGGVAKQALDTVLQTPVEAGKRFLKAATTDMAASTLKGFSAASTTQQEASIDQRANELVQNGLSIPEAVRLAKEEGQANTPIVERPLYKFGKRIQQFGDELFAPRPEWMGANQGLPKQVIGDLAAGFGSVAGNIGTSLIPGVGAPLLIGTATSQSASEAEDNALKAGANEQQQEIASRWGVLPGVLDLGDMFLPGAGKGARLARRWITGGLNEGAQEGAQQFGQNVISQQVHSPNQNLMEDVLYNAAIGTVVGGATKGAIGERPGREVPPASTEDINKTQGELGQVAQSRQTPPSDQPLEVLASTRLRENAPVFYSTLKQTVLDKGPEVGGSDQWLGLIRNAPGVKQEERDYTGVEDFIASQGGRVSKKDILAHLEERQVNVDEVVRGADEPPPSWTEVGTDIGYGQYRTPGPSENYRELLLTLPNPSARPIPDLKGLVGAEREAAIREHSDSVAGDFNSSHWSTPNVLSHIRFDERVDASGTPILHVAEIQSDWHQKGREVGYNRPVTQDDIEHMGGDEFRVISANKHFRVPGGHAVDWNTADARILAEANRVVNSKAIPDAPFKSSWVDLSIKRMLRWAADNGYSRITWDPAAKQIARYPALSPAQQRGMQEFYDKVLPSRMKYWAKKFGGNYGTTTIEASPATNLSFPTRVPYIEVPERAMTIIQQGLPLFSKKPDLNIASEIKDKMLSIEALREMQRAVEAMREIAKEFNLTLPLSILLTDKGLLKDAFAQAERYGDRYRIVINPFLHSNAAEVYANAMHEFGHVVMWDKFEKASDKEKRAIRQAYREYRNKLGNDSTMSDLLTIRDNAVMNYFQSKSNPETNSVPLSALTPAQRKYWAGFEEWFAEQTAKWATTTEKPLTLAETVFQGIGKLMLKILTHMRAKLQLPNAFPSKVMGEWLDSFMVSAPPLAPQIFDDLDNKTQRENQNIIDNVAPEVGATPAQPETDGIREGIDKVFDGHDTPIEIKENIAFADRMNWFYKMMLDVTQMAQNNPQLIPLQTYVENLRALHIDDSKITDTALRVMKAWRALGEEGNRLPGLLDDVANMVYRTDDEVRRGVARHPTPQELGALTRKHQIGNEGLAVFRQINRMFDVALTLSEQLAVGNALKITDPVARAEAIRQIQAKTANLRASPYFPFMRFGRHVVIVRNAAGKVVQRLHVERRGLFSAAAMQKKLAAELERTKNPGEVVQIDVLKEDTGPMVGMPSHLLDMMDKRLDLSATQRDALEQLRFEMSPGQSHRHRFQHKNYIAGYDMDFKRSFANYFFHFGKFYSKTKYADALRDNIRGVDASVQDSLTPVKRREIANFMRNHLQNDVLNPKADFVHLKAALVFWALAYVPASAAVNLSQTPMITLPFLGSKFGDVKAASVLAQVMADLKTFSKRGSYNNLTDFEMRAIDYGIRTGRIIEAMAPELAGMSEGRNLAAGWGGNIAQRGFTRFMEVGMKMFELAEQFNRRIAYRAALRLAHANPNAAYVNEVVAKYGQELQTLLREGFTEAEARSVVVASHATDQTQFVYTRYARPRVMRGKFGTLFLFKKYMQSLFFLGLTNKKDFLPRYMVMALLMGGLMGFPGGDDAKDLIRALAHWLFGKDFDVERELRKFIIDFTNGKMDPDMLLHGMARNGFGIPSILNMAGNSVGLPNVAPNVDMSRALSMGNVLPLNVGKMLGPEAVADRTISEESARAGGVVASVGTNMYKAIISRDEPGDFKRWEKMLPRAVGNLSRSYRAYDEGMERNKTGAAVVRFDIRDPQQAAEVLGMAGGFQPQRLQQKWDEVRMQQEAIKYADVRRELILRQFFTAVTTEKGSRDSVLEAVRKFNADYPSKAITTDVLRASVNTRMRSRNAQESGTPIKRSDVPIAQEIQKLFPSAPIDVRRVR